MDTVFSTVPTSTRSFWVYNKSGDGIRCTSVRLANGNQTGFRVNVDGEYLSPTAGYQVQNVEIRNKDSIRVFVELTSPTNGKDGPQLIEDNLVFTLESGVEQRINLNAYTWDAQLMRNVVISSDSTIGGGTKPIVIYGGLRVDSLATLHITAGTTLYFHSDAGINVYGRLVSEGAADNNIILRGDRTDKMFDYLPYDMVSGQWKGIVFHSSSYDNVINYTDIHSTFDGIVCDSSDVSKMKLQLFNSTVHNCQGYGLKTVSCKVDVRNCQITNTLQDCVAILGGNVNLTHCTIAQFYPFDSKYELMQDEEIINKIKAGDKSALNYLMDKYKELVNMKVSKYFIVGAERDDTVQEGMIGLFKAIKSFDPDKQNSFKSFANICIERQLITAIKSSNRQKHMPLNSYLSLNTAAYDNEEDSVELIETFNNKTVEDPLETIMKQEYLNEVEDAVNKNLSKFEKQVLDRFLRGESYVKIAKNLDSPVKSVDNAIQRIRKKAIKNINEKNHSK